MSHKYCLQYGKSGSRGARIWRRNTGPDARYFAEHGRLFSSSISRFLFFFFFHSFPFLFSLLLDFTLFTFCGTFSMEVNDLVDEAYDAGKDSTPWWRKISRLKNTARCRSFFSQKWKNFVQEDYFGKVAVCASRQKKKEEKIEKKKKRKKKRRRYPRSAQDALAGGIRLPSNRSCPCLVGSSAVRKVLVQRKREGS